MPNASRKSRSQVSPVSSGVEGVFALWGRGNLKAARLAARELLRGELSEGGRADMERLLQDTGPDPRAARIALFAVAVVGLVILLTKLFD